MLNIKKIRIEPHHSYDPQLPTFTDSCNPQLSATHQLLQISNEYSYQPQQNGIGIQKQDTNRTESNAREQLHAAKLAQPRLSVTCHFTKSHLMRRKPSLQPVSTHPQETTLKSANKYQSSFIIFQNGYVNNNTNQESNQLVFNQLIAKHSKPKPVRNILAFIKRKRTTNLKAEADICLSDRTAISCDLSRKQTPLSPMKIVTTNRVSEQSMIEFRCTNPNFRNKKFNSYLKMATGKAKAARNER